MTRAWGAPTDPSCPQTTGDLYSRIRSVKLDATRVYHIREASIRKPTLDLSFEDGALAFTEDICGRITGAFFAGDGEVLLRPPNRVERASMALFTKMAILEEPFTSGYLRFNDDTAEVLRPYLSPAADAAEFLQEWGETAEKLGEFDALRLLLDFSHFLPPQAQGATSRTFPSLLHAHLIGKTLGAFEIFWDATNSEPLWAGQARTSNDETFFDVWTSFVPPVPASHAAPPRLGNVSCTAFQIHAAVHPPTELKAETQVEIRVRNGGPRMLLFELSRFLKVESVTAEGKPVDFLQNPALAGTELRRKGNDLVGIVFPAELKTGQQMKLTFRYAGDVLSDAGSGLLYVGARGNWYPNTGLSPATFDMEFRYPAKWTLVATGKLTSPTGGEAETNVEAAGETVSHWVSERPIVVAGFNLGRYQRTEAKSGKIVVRAFATGGVEKTFPKPAPELVVPPTFPGPRRTGDAPTPVITTTPPPPSPARNAQPVADRGAEVITSFSKWFGPFPYSSLALTQMPGDLSQGWPGMVFLSSFAFLNPREQEDLHIKPLFRELSNLVLAHEIAHQWWGDLILWKGYRDQWMMEGLANYSALLILERQNPGRFHDILEKYRNDLASKNKDDEFLREAGPVTLGQRLVSSHFPAGYDLITYERGTWLLHMLRSMMRDAESGPRVPRGAENPDEPFFRVLRKAVERFGGKSMSTTDLMQIFEEELPRPLWYDNRHKLDWFVDSWINGTAMPELSTREIRTTEKAGVTTVSGIIVQKDAPENLITAVPIYAESATNSLVYLGEVLADGKETSFRFTTPAKVRKVVVDPKQTILTAPK